MTSCVHCVFMDLFVHIPSTESTLCFSQDKDIRIILAYMYEDKALITVCQVCRYMYVIHMKTPILLLYTVHVVLRN